MKLNLEITQRNYKRKHNFNLYRVIDVVKVDVE